MLKVNRFGASFHNLRNLSSLGLTITIDDGYMGMLETHLANHLPIIVSVQTEELPYWQNRATLHAVVVVGINDTTVSLNDPAFQSAPQTVARADFESAWLEREYLYSLIQPVV